MKVQNKVIVVTGGASGIGRELVLQLSAKGASVAAVDINEEALHETFALAGGNTSKVSTHVVNLTERDRVEALPDEVIARHGVVDGIINNAGIIQPFVYFNDLGYDAIERVLNVNLYGTIYMIKTFLPHLLERPEAHIVNISSMAGFLPVPAQTLYGASKAAIKLLTEGLNSELLATNVGVTVVFPGSVRTNIVVNSGVTASLNEEVDAESYRSVTPREAARKIIEGIERNRYRVLIGSDAIMMDLLYRLSPKRAAKFIYRQMRSLLPD